MKIREPFAAALTALTALTIVSVGIASLFQPGFPPSWSGDAYGHLFEVWKLYHYGWEPWIEDWYSGFPFLRFYPPLAYLAAWGLSIIASDPVAGYKLLVALSIPLAAAFMYIALRRLGFGRLASYTAGVVYATSPWILRVVSPEGAMPRVFGFAVAPLTIIALHMVVEGRRWSEPLLAGFLFSLLILTHHTLAVTVAAISLIIVIAAIIHRDGGSFAKLLSRIGVKRFATNFALLLVSAVLVSSFWLVPFIADRNLASFTSETGTDYLFRMQSVKPAQLITPEGMWSYFQGYLRFSAPLVLLAVALLKRGRPVVVSSILVVSVYLILVLLSLGAYGPTPWLNRLPLVEYIPPYRWLDALQMVYAYALAAAIDIALPASADRRRRLVAAAIGLLIIAAAAAESYGRLEYLRAESFDRDLAAALNFIGGDNTTGWRFYQWALALSKGSMVGFSPAVAGKPSLNGWYRQGDPLYILHGELGWALRNDAAYAESLLRLFGVKYVVVDDGVPGSDRVKQILTSIGFAEVFRSGSVSVYAGNNSVVQVVAGRILAVSCSPDVVKYVFPEAEAGRSCSLDDYSQSDLWGYSAVILYDYRYSDPKSWALFLDYAARGGILVVDTYRSPDAMRGIPGTGIRSEISRNLGPVLIALRSGGVLELNLTYEGGPWVSTVYSCSNCSVIASSGDAAIIASAQYGQGAVYAVGFNLFYYAYYTGNTSIRDLLRDLMPAVSTGYAEAVLEEWSDGYMRVRCRADAPFVLRVAEAWFPHWRAYIDSKPAPVQRSREGLIVLSVPPGEHVVELVFEDPYIGLRYVSSAAAIAIVALHIYARVAGSRRRTSEAR